MQEGGLLARGGARAWGWRVLMTAARSKTRRDETAEAAKMQMTERDRNLCAVLAGARWLTAEQLRRLCFPQRNERDVRRRLQQLGGVDGLPPLLKQHKWVTKDALRHVWGLSPHGYAEAEPLMDQDVFLPPKKGFEPETMAHHEMLTELYVGLLAAPLEAALARVPKELTPATRRVALAGLFARAQHRGWRWIVVGDGVHLAWRYKKKEGLFGNRVMRPDAVLELHEAKRRIFIECETGANTIKPRFGDNKPNSTLSKLNRWEEFFSGLASYHPRRTHYEERYRDGYAPEVLFLSHSDRRVRNVNAAVAEWRRTERDRPDLVVRVWTLNTALGELLPVSGALKEEPAQRVLPAELANAVDGIEAPALVRFINGISRDLDERLRSASITNSAKPFVPEGWEMAKRVAKRLAAGAPAGGTRRPLNTGELLLFRKFRQSTEAIVHAARVDARARKVPVPAYPPEINEVEDLLDKLADGK